jgi:hypothetical protein
MCAHVFCDARGIGKGGGGGVPESQYPVKVCVCTLFGTATKRSITLRLRQKT